MKHTIGDRGGLTMGTGEVTPLELPGRDHRIIETKVGHIEIDHGVVSLQKRVQSIRGYRPRRLGTWMKHPLS